MRWKPIKGFDDYLISCKGDILSLRNKTPRVLKSYPHPTGYMLCNLSGNKDTRLLHRLVAINYIPNPGNKKEVNHKDGNKTNNKVSNLEWVTPSENIKHAFKMGLLDHKGENHPMVKLTNKIVLEIDELIKRGVSNAEIARIYNIHANNVSSIRRGYRWGHITKRVYNPKLRV